MSAFLVELETKVSEYLETLDDSDESKSDPWDTERGHANCELSEFLIWLRPAPQVQEEGDE